MRRSSGAVVPARHRSQRVAAIGGTILAAVLLASPIATGIFAVSSAASDVVQAIRAVMPLPSGQYENGCR